MNDKNTPIQTFLHYSDPTARKERTVFGERKEGLFYNYDDRLFGEKWREGQDIANKSDSDSKTAKWYEIILNHYHDTNTVDLQHATLGCNMSNGQSYLVFGYTYDLKKKSPNMIGPVAREFP